MFRAPWSSFGRGGRFVHHEVDSSSLRLWLIARPSPSFNAPRPLPASQRNYQKKRLTPNPKLIRLRRTAPEGSGPTKPPLSGPSSDALPSARKTPSLEHCKFAYAQLGCRDRSPDEYWTTCSLFEEARSNAKSQPRWEAAFIESKPRYRPKSSSRSN
jgi:hypothetical protein